MYCTNCGNKLNPGDKFCGNCGAPVVHRNGQNQEGTPNQNRNPNVDPNSYQSGSQDQKQRDHRGGAALAGAGAGLAGVGAAESAAKKAAEADGKKFSKSGSLGHPSGKSGPYMPGQKDGIELHQAADQAGRRTRAPRGGRFSKEGIALHKIPDETGKAAAGKAAASAAGKTAAVVTAHAVPVKAVAVAVAVAAAGTAGGVAYKAATDHHDDQQEAVVSSSSGMERLLLADSSEELSDASSESLVTTASSSAEEVQPWMISYQKFLDDWRLDDQYYGNSYLNMYFSGQYDFDQYCLIDVDGNAIPELFLYSTLTDLTHIYTCDEDGNVSASYYEGQVMGINEDQHAVVTNGHWHGAGGSGFDEYYAHVLDGPDVTLYGFDYQGGGYYNYKYEHYNEYMAYSVNNPDAENDYRPEDLPSDQATYDQLYNQYVLGAKPYEEYPKLPLTTPIYTGNGDANGGSGTDSEAAWITGCYTSTSLQPSQGIRIWQDGSAYKVDFFADLNKVTCDATMDGGVLTVQGSQGPFTLRRDESSGTLFVEGNAYVAFEAIVVGETTTTEYSFQDTYARSYDANPDGDTIIRGARESLGVPADANVTAEIGDPYFYYQYGDNGSWGVSVSFRENGSYVASGTAEPDTGIVDRDIYMYQPAG